MEALGNLPKNLHETYDRILSGLEDDQDVPQILCWIAFSYRPLTQEELAEVPCIQFLDTHSTKFQYQPELRIHDILSLCSSLVTSTEGESSFIL